MSKKNRKRVSSAGDLPNAKVSCRNIDIPSDQRRQQQQQQSQPTSHSASLAVSAIDSLLDSVFEQVLTHPDQLHVGAPAVSEQIERIELQSTSPPTMSSTIPVSQHRSRQNKRTRTHSYHGIVYLNDDETAVDCDDSSSAIKAKKPRTGSRTKNTSCVAGDCSDLGSGGADSGGTTDVSVDTLGAAADPPTVAASFISSSTQTEWPGCCPFCTTSRVQKSLSETVSEGMTTFTTTVSATISSMQRDLNELQDVVIQLSAELGEMHNLRDTVQHISAELAAMRSAAMLNQPKEPGDSTSTWTLVTSRPRGRPSRVPAPAPAPTAVPAPTAAPVLATAADPVVTSAPGSTSRPSTSTQAAQRAAERARSRASSVVVSGLPLHALAADKTIVRDLFATELKLIPDVVKCRRLGRPVSGKVQPLLVVLRTAHQADQVMSQAKLLRSSPHSVIRDCVFISKQLSEVESRAAFEVRRERRAAVAAAAATRRQQRSNPTGKPLRPSNWSTDRPVSRANRRYNRLICYPFRLVFRCPPRSRIHSDRRHGTRCARRSDRCPR